MKSRFALLSLILCLAMLLLTGCSVNMNTVADQSNQSDTQSNVYNIELDKDNYWKYLNWDQKNSTFTGVLTFAYYENVVITLKRTISSPEYTDSTFTEPEFSVELNAAGCQQYTLKSYTMEEMVKLLHYDYVYLGGWTWDLEITSISGRVLFSIE